MGTKREYDSEILESMPINIAKRRTEFNSVGLPVEEMKSVNKVNDSDFENLKNGTFLGYNGNDGHLIGYSFKNKKVRFDENLNRLAPQVELIRSICKGDDQSFGYLMHPILLSKTRGHTVGVPVKYNKSLKYTH